MKLAVQIGLTVNLLLSHLVYFGKQRRERRRALGAPARGNYWSPNLGKAKRGCRGNHTSESEWWLHAYSTVTPMHEEKMLQWLGGNI